MENFAVVRPSSGIEPYLTRMQAQHDLYMLGCVDNSSVGGSRVSEIQYQEYRLALYYMYLSCM